MATATVTQRFWGKVEKQEGCWGWKGATINGYGAFKADGVMVKAHRVSYEIHHGPIPQGLGVLHYCDTKSCTNPEHLFAGDRFANMSDAAAKGRMPIGERHHKARLTIEQVVEARYRHAQGETPKAIAQSLGVHRSTIQRAVFGETWRRATAHLTENYE